MENTISEHVVKDGEGGVCFRLIFGKTTNGSDPHESRHVEQVVNNTFPLVTFAWEDDSLDADVSHCASLLCEAQKSVGKRWNIPNIA